MRRLSELPQLPTHLVAATDDLFAMTILKDGGVDHLLRRLIEHGLDPRIAIRIATYNAAFRLGRTDLGMIAPGRLADLVILSDLPSLLVDEVYAAGQLVAAGGQMVVPSAQPTVSAPTGSMKLARLTVEDFDFRVSTGSGAAEFRVLKGAVFTEWETRKMRTSEGSVELPIDCIFQAVFHRHGRRDPRPTVGILSGWGALSGAIATSVSHDTHNLVVFGRQPRDMAVAANAVIDADGGVAVAAAGQVIAMIALPIAGLLSPLPADVVAEAQERLQRAALEIGLVSTTLSQPLFQVMTATLPCIPGPHVTDVAIIDGGTGEVLSSLPVAVS